MGPQFPVGGARLQRFQTSGVEWLVPGVDRRLPAHGYLCRREHVRSVGHGQQSRRDEIVWQKGEWRPKNVGPFGQSAGGRRGVKKATSKGVW